MDNPPTHIMKRSVEAVYLTIIMKFLHTCYRVVNLEKSVEFYNKALGFSETRRRDFPEYKFTLVYMALPDSTHELELTYNYDHVSYELGNGYSHIAVSVENLEAEHEKHKNAGYKVSEMSGLPGAAPMFYFITDPDGYEIEVIRA